MGPLLLGVALAAAPSVDEPPITGARAADDRAVVIANEGYTGGFGVVPYANRDAEAFAAWLTRTRGLPGVNVARVNGATRKGMVEAVTRAAADVPDGGTLWVYYAGHGLGLQLDAAPERVLLGINAIAQADELPDYVVPVAALERIAAGSRAAHAVFVLDACFNNAGRGGEALVSGRFAVPIGELEAGSRVTVWAATGPKETAVAYDPAQHGAFTYLAVGALSGWADGVSAAPDGQVTLEEAQTWVRRAMLSVGVSGQSPRLTGPSELVAASGKLAPEPSLTPGGGDSAGSFGFQGDLAAKLAAQRCDEEAVRLAEAQAAARAEVAAAKLRAEAKAAWARLVPELQSCTKRANKGACLDEVRAFLAAGKAAKVDIAASVEAVSTGCGPRSRAVEARSVAVTIPEVSDAQGWLLRLAGRAPRLVAKKNGRSPFLGALIWVPPGTFTMGTAVTEFGRPAVDRIPHEVTLTRGFHMMATEVTQGMYRALTGLDPSAPEMWGHALLGDDRPVQSVTWLEAVAFANVVSEAEGLSACYTIAGDTVGWTPGCSGYRLPTEAEWERAARGGAPSRYAGTDERDAVCAFGNVADTSFKPEQYGWGRGYECDDGAPGVAKVASYRPNPYGLYDMTGNINEFTWDWVADYTSAPATDPVGPASGRYRATRGGSWLHQPGVDNAWRNSGSLDNRHPAVGFRLVRSIP